MRLQILTATLFVLLTAIKHSHAIPAAYGACQASCATVVGGCYLLHGAVFGALRATFASPALLRCNAAFGRCQASCATIWIARTDGLTALEQLEQQMGGMSLGSAIREEEVLDSLRDGLAKMNIR